ncbi:MAG: hypothetical protein R3345_01265 [Fulvivirga sp.]|nr:hypothetical protein [Fulvivirga sp.]
MRVFFILSILFICQHANAQRGKSILSLLDSLEYVDELPEDLLATKSLVLVAVPDESRSPKIRGDWKKLAEKAQPGFRKAGIDAVAYYHLSDVYSGPEAAEAFAEKFEERLLDNVIFLWKKDDQYEIILTKISSEEGLIESGQKAWSIKGKDIDKMTHEIYLKAANSGQERKNLLIIEVPIYGEMAEIIKGRRGEYFDVNFASETLAVPAFADTSQINKVMSKYPYNYEIVDPALSERELRDQGYQYVLYYVHTIGKNVKSILEYPTEASETAYISEVVNGNPKVKSINIYTPVYKFYIKHIYSENVFLGTKWDADTTWWDALNNYITNLKNQLVND